MNLKNSILVLLLLSCCGSGFSCGFYPYGEELRFCFLAPSAFDYGQYSEFAYSSNSFDTRNGDVYRPETMRPNEGLWFDYCEKKVPVPEIRAALDLIPKSEIGPNSSNLMIRYLYANKDHDAVDYLIFAKECEMVNGWSDDPWERNRDDSAKARETFIAIALKKAEKTKNGGITKRYAFQAIRLSFYNQNTSVIKDTYDRYFADENLDVIGYWSLYFRSFGQVNPELADFWGAQIFAHAPEKRFAVYNQLYHKSPISEMLKFAKTDEERANVVILTAAGKEYPALDDIKKTYAFQKKSEGLGFLLLREMNKIEDWIFTPYYSLFNPSVYSKQTDYDEENSREILKRVERDRLYAQSLLEFIESADLQKVYDQRIWKMARIELLFMTKQYRKCITSANSLESEFFQNADQLSQLRKIKALAMIAEQTGRRAVILPEVQQILLENQKDKQFVFAIGRELENKGNTADAALLYAALQPSWETGVVFWKQKNSKSLYEYTDYHSDYFSYINIAYTPEQVAELVASVEKFNQNAHPSAFEKWKFKELAQDIDLLCDLLGTKFMRRNDLASAQKAFDALPEKYWTDHYSGWERRKLDSDYYIFASGGTLRTNPFFNLNGVDAFAMPVSEGFRLTKASIVKKLSEYLKKAENPLEKNRDYYYFLVGNCYYNMSYYGNAWMMNRFYHSLEGVIEPNVEGDRDYYGCALAKKYYEKGAKSSKNLKFKMLCLRMAGTCADWEISYDRALKSKSTDIRWGGMVTPLNRYFVEMQRYEDEYNELTFRCEFFGKYFDARRDSGF